MEFRQARAEQGQAIERVQKIVPNVQAEIIDFEAKRNHRLQIREEAAALAQAKRRIGGMSSAELKEEIERLRPPNVDEVVARDPLVQTARQEQAALSGQLQRAQAEAAIAQLRSRSGVLSIRAGRGCTTRGSCNRAI